MSDKLDPPSLKLTADNGRIQLLWVDHPTYEKFYKPYKWFGILKRSKPYGKTLLPSSCYYEIDGVCYRDTVQPGYEWDGASVPRLLWPVGGHPFAHDLEAAGLFHDIWYGSHAISREDADHLFGLIIRYFGGEPRHREVAVRLFGLLPWCEGSASERAYNQTHLVHKILPTEESRWP